jgi:hypothetical protein
MCSPSSIYAYFILEKTLTSCTDFAQMFCKLGSYLVKVKLYLYKHLGLQKVEAPKISRQIAQEGGKVVSPTHRPPITPRKHSWYSFLLETELTPAP